MCWMAVESAPAFLCGLSELEHHGQAGSSSAASLGPAVAQPNGGERRFDGVGRPQVLPVFGREVIEGQQHVAILLADTHRPPDTWPGIFPRRGRMPSRIRSLVSAIQISWRSALALGCTLLGILLSTLAVL